MTSLYRLLSLVAGVLVLAGRLSATPFTVSNTGASGAGSFSQAILDANGDNTATAASPHQINFTVTGTTNFSGNVYHLTTLMWSDARLKTNVQTLDNALDKVMKLRGVYFDYRRDAFPDTEFPAGRRIGFIAQEVEPIVPEVVADAPDGKKAVAYENITALLVNAVHEQAQISTQGSDVQQVKSDVDQLRATNEGLRLEYENLKSRLDQIEKLLREHGLDLVKSPELGSR